MVIQPEQQNRLARIAELKRRIAEGVYETPEKLEAALDAFLEDDRRGEVRPGEDRSSYRNRPK